MSEAIIKSYIDAVEKSDWENLMKLFSKKAKIISSINNYIDPALFYKEYFHNILYLNIDIKGIYTSNSNPYNLIVHLTKNITLIDSKNIIYDAVQIFHFSEDYKYINNIEMLCDNYKSQLNNINNLYYEEIRNHVD